MHLTTILTTLAALMTLTLAAPLAPEPNLPIPQNPTKDTQSSAIIGKTPASLSTASSSSQYPSTSPTLPPYACPKNKYKGCCDSVQQQAKELIKPLGQVVPILGGVQISSPITFQCNPMSDTEAPDNCQQVTMCCDSKASGVLDSCTPLAQAKEEAEGKKESQAQMINDVMS